MHRSRVRRAAVVPAAVVVAVVVLGACSVRGGERVGGAAEPAPRVVTVLSQFGKPAAQPFADEVDRLSEGHLEVRVVAADDPTTSYDAAAIRAVRAGEADLGLAGARAWDEFGAPALTTLAAPLLVDSYALEDEVLSGDVVPTLLEQLPDDLTGLGVLPGPIRRPFGRSRALVAPQDFAGTLIGTQQSHVADATLRALGARPVRLGSDAGASPAYAGVDGLETSVDSIESGRLDVPGSHLTTNVNLWPRPLVLFAGPSATAVLDAADLDVLRTAAKNAVAPMTQSAQALDDETAANLCRKGNVRLDQATPPELEAWHDAVRPVYDDLERDALSRRVIAEIEDLRDQLGEPPTALASCATGPGAADVGEPSDLDGVWVMDTDASAAEPDGLDENWGHWVFVFDRGRFAITQENKTSCTWGYGTFSVEGSRTAWTFVDGGGIAPNNATNRPGEYFVFDLSFYRDTVTLAPVAGEISPLNFRDEPWRRVADAPTTERLSTRCPPPADAWGS